MKSSFLPAEKRHFEKAGLKASIKYNRPVEKSNALEQLFSNDVLGSGNGAAARCGWVIIGGYINSFCGSFGDTESIEKFHHFGRVKPAIIWNCSSQDFTFENIFVDAIAKEVSGGTFRTLIALCEGFKIVWPAPSAWRIL